MSDPSFTRCSTEAVQQIFSNIQKGKQRGESGDVVEITGRSYLRGMKGIVNQIYVPLALTF
jgi:hypothetical protein